MEGESRIKNPGHAERGPIQYSLQITSRLRTYNNILYNDDGLRLSCSLK